MVLLASTSRFFKAADLEHEKKFRIKSVTEEVFGEQKEKKPVVWFTKDERGLALNIINRRTLQGAFGDETDGWVGKIIIIYPTTVDFRGKPTPGLRVRIPPPKGNGQPVTAKAPEPVLPPAAAVGADDELDDETNF
jgi:hypothetical protein